MKPNKSILIAIIVMYITTVSVTAYPTGYIDYPHENINLTDIEIIQKEIDEHGYSWTAGETSVSGLSQEEKRILCNTVIPEYPPTITSQRVLASETSFNTTFDWRNKDGKDWMTSVKNQGTCGSCWAFSAIGVVETAMNIAAGDPDMNPDLSEQYLVSDCCEKCGNCNGGCPLFAMEHIRDVGIAIEADVPYNHVNSVCIQPDLIHPINDIIWCQSNEEALKWNLKKYGALSVLCSVKHDFMYYVSGVYEPTMMGSANHAVVLVGWNDTENCWIIKNSWGENWGDHGYGKIKYGVVEDHNYAFTVSISPHVVPDAYEPDNGIVDAMSIMTDGTVYYHNFHNSGDTDWVKFNGIPGETYIIETTTIGHISNTILTLMYFGDDTHTIKDDDGGVGYGSKIIYNCTTIGTHYVCISNGKNIPFDNHYAADNDYRISITLTDEDSEHIPGDVTGDGKVNIGDAVLLFNWVSFLNERDTTYALNKPDNANVNGDTTTNIGDAVLLFNWVSFPNERGGTYVLQYTETLK